MDRKVKAKADVIELLRIHNAGGDAAKEFAAISSHRFSDVAAAIGELAQEVPSERDRKFLEALEIQFLDIRKRYAR